MTEKLLTGTLSLNTNKQTNKQRAIDRLQSVTGLHCDCYILQAYNDCLQLQLQQNLAQRAIDRLQSAIGLHCDCYILQAYNDCL